MRWLWYENVEGNSFEVILGICPVVPYPNVGDRVKFRGGYTLSKLFHNEWGTVVAVTPKSYLVVEPDFKPGEYAVGIHDVKHINRGAEGTPAPVRAAKASEEWRKEHPGEWTKKDQLYRKKLKRAQRSIATIIRKKLGGAGSK